MNRGKGHRTARTQPEGAEGSGELVSRTAPELAEEWDALGIHERYISHPYAEEWWDDARKLIGDGRHDKIACMVFLLMRSEQRMDEQRRLMEACISSLRLNKLDAAEEAIELLGFDPRQERQDERESEAGCRDAHSSLSCLTKILGSELEPIRQSLWEVRSQLSILETVLRIHMTSNHVWDFKRSEDPDVLMDIVSPVTSENKTVGHLYFKGFIKLVKIYGNTDNIIYQCNISGKGAKGKLYKNIIANIPPEARERILDLPIRERAGNDKITPEAVVRALSRMDHPLLTHGGKATTESTASGKLVLRGLTVKETIDRMLPAAKLWIDFERRRIV